MFDVSGLETIVLLLIVMVHATAGTLAAVHLLRKHRRYEWLLTGCVSAAAMLDAVLLAVRGVSIKAIPLTSLFDSLILLALVFGVLYLLMKRAADQVWFDSVMVWSISGVVLAAALVARPASRPEEVARTPWAVAHASFMILATASIVFAAANSVLYLLGSYRLKHKAIMHVLGRIPNMETLARMNHLGVRVGFVLLTVGMVNGLGLSLLDTGLATWLADSKVICIIGAWSLLGAILVLDRLGLLKVKARAYATIVVFGFILIAIIGVTVAGATQHRFSQGARPRIGTLTT
ncbi:MAG: cytochrome c biogenesis protein CcsA [Sedimentisphaerales bacterium]|nr:cytochrome c biogenesis protein CcsA [Sedimentisphaerales bacterium]